MNTAFAGIVFAGLAIAGCTKGSDPGGGVGNDSFRLVVPTAAAAVKQGEVQTVRIQVDRGSGFKQGVRLEAKAPAGLTVEPNSPTVGPEDKGDVQIKITAAKDAPLGEHIVQLKGTPDKGEPTTTDLKVTVAAK